MQLVSNFIVSNKALVIIFAFFLFFSMLTPLTGDDYTWANYYLSLEGKGRLLDSFQYLYQNLNGRIAGNALELFLINHAIAASIFKALIFTGIVTLVVRILGIRSRTITYLTALLVALPSIGIFRQVISWSAGFYNYVVPVFLFLAIYHLIRRGGSSIITHVSVLLLSLLSSLFMENMTILAAMTALLWLIIDLMRRSFDSKVLVSLIGLVAGAIIMFSSPVYMTISRGEDGYRSMASSDGGGLLSRVIDNSSEILNFLVYDIIHVYIAMFFIVIIINISTKRALGAKIEGIRSVSLGLMGGSLGVLLITKGLDTALGTIPEYVYTLIKAFVYSAFILSLLVNIFIVSKSSKQKLTVLSLIMLSVGLVSPLILITPFGHRNFYASYVVLLILIGFMLTSMTKPGLAKVIKTGEFLWVRSFAAIVSIAVICMFMAIKFIEVRNELYVKESLEKKGSYIVLRRYPFEGLIQSPSDGSKHARMIGRYDCEYVKCRVSNPITVVYE